MKFSFSTIYKIRFVLAGLLLALTSHSQSNPNSVYSRFGLGLLQPPGSAIHFGMGGVTAPLSDPIALNLANPASYSFLDVTNLQIAAKGGYTKASNASASSEYANGQIHEFAMGFKKPGSKWAFAVGLSPFSSVDYSFSSEDALSDSLTATYSYTGNGGLSKATIGASRLFRYYSKPVSKDSSLPADSSSIRIHQLSIGMNADYVFGNITRENKIEFDNSEHYSTINKVNLWTQGFIMEAGLLYKVNLTTRRDEQKRITGGSLLQIGADYMLNSSLFADYSELISSVRVFTSTALRDTTLYLESEKGRLKIPQRITVGMAYKIYDKRWGTFTLAGEYWTQDWSAYKLAITSEANLDKGLSASSGISAGIEYRPSTDANTGFFNRLNYRAGIRLSESPLVLNNVRVKQQGITAGITVPVVKSLTRFHLGAEFGNTGSTDAGLVHEKYVTFMAALTLTPSAFDRWFRQVKYD